MSRELPAIRESDPSRPTRRSTFDHALAVGAIGLAIVEGLLRTNLPLRPLQLAAAIVVGATLWWRRTHPLPALLVAFGLAHALTLVQLAFALPELGLHATAVVLLHPYSLLRYGSRREVAIGLVAVVSVYVTARLAGEMRDVREAIGALVVLLFPAALGASLRFRDLAHRREVEHAQLRERQMLARELHDTVAHHVSAIVIQAQAARAVAASRPDAAATALVAIEVEAKRSLTELRALVGALRDDTIERAPIGCARAIEDLVRDAGDHVTLEVSGDFDQLPPTVDLALHRIARESLHNALTHARGATRIDVRLSSCNDTVRLVVRDDGKHAGSRARTGRDDGLGIVGMKERAMLLGGSLEAGPLSSGGWQVEVVLPRGGVRG